MANGDTSATGAGSTNQSDTTSETTGTSTQANQGSTTTTSTDQAQFLVLGDAQVDVDTTNVDAARTAQLTGPES
ncbi:MAG TPA: hypothetical protein VF342_03520, partial [Alphaproteobacteria bacterium]